MITVTIENSSQASRRALKLAWPLKRLLMRHFGGIVRLQIVTTYGSFGSLDVPCSERSLEQ